MRSSVVRRRRADLLVVFAFALSAWLQPSAGSHEYEVSTADELWNALKGPDSTSILLISNISLPATWPKNGIPITDRRWVRGDQVACLGRCNINIGGSIDEPRRFAHVHSGGYFEGDSLRVTSAYANLVSQLEGGTVGGVVYVARHSEVKFANCAFEANNMVSGWGGSVYVESGLGTFEHCMFRSSYALRGGAVRMRGETGASSYATFSDCFFEQNSAEYGGAVDVGYKSMASFQNCTFYANTAGNMGGAIFLEYSQAMFVNSTFTENMAELQGEDAYLRSSVAGVYPPLEENATLLWGGLDESTINHLPGSYQLPPIPEPAPPSPPHARPTVSTSDHPPQISRTTHPTSQAPPSLPTTLSMSSRPSQDFKGLWEDAKTYGTNLPPYVMYAGAALGALLFGSLLFCLHRTRVKAHRAAAAAWKERWRQKGEGWSAMHDSADNSGDSGSGSSSEEDEESAFATAVRVRREAQERAAAEARSTFGGRNPATRLQPLDTREQRPTREDPLQQQPSVFGAARQAPAEAPSLRPKSLFEMQLERGLAPARPAPARDLHDAPAFQRGAPLQGEPSPFGRDARDSAAPSVNLWRSPAATTLDPLLDPAERLWRAPSAAQPNPQARLAPLNKANPDPLLERVDKVKRVADPLLDPWAKSGAERLDSRLQGQSGPRLGQRSTGMPSATRTPPNISSIDPLLDSVSDLWGDAPTSFATRRPPATTPPPEPGGASRSPRLQRASSPPPTNKDSEIRWTQRPPLAPAMADHSIFQRTPPHPDTGVLLQQRSPPDASVSRQQPGIFDSVFRRHAPQQASEPIPARQASSASSVDPLLDPMEQAPAPQPHGGLWRGGRAASQANAPLGPHPHGKQPQEPIALNAAAAARRHPPPPPLPPPAPAAAAPARAPSGNSIDPLLDSIATDPSTAGTAAARPKAQAAVPTNGVFQGASARRIPPSATAPTDPGARTPHTQGAGGSPAPSMRDPPRPSHTPNIYVHEAAAPSTSGGAREGPPTPKQGAWQTPSHTDPLLDDVPDAGESPDDYLSSLLGGRPVPAASRLQQQQSPEKVPPHQRSPKQGGSRTPPGRGKDDYLSNLLAGRKGPEADRPQHQHQHQHQQPSKKAPSHQRTTSQAGARTPPAGGKDDYLSNLLAGRTVPAANRQPQQQQQQQSPEKSPSAKSPSRAPPSGSQEPWRGAKTPQHPRADTRSPAGKPPRQPHTPNVYIHEAPKAPADRGGAGAAAKQTPLHEDPLLEDVEPDDADNKDDYLMSLLGTRGSNSHRSEQKAPPPRERRQQQQQQSPEKVPPHQRSPKQGGSRTPPGRGKDDYLSNLLAGRKGPEADRPQHQHQHQQRSPEIGRPPPREDAKKASDDFLSNLLGGKAVPASNRQPPPPPPQQPYPGSQRPQAGGPIQGWSEAGSGPQGPDTSHGAAHSTVSGADHGHGPKHGQGHEQSDDYLSNLLGGEAVPASLRAQGQQQQQQQQQSPPQARPRERGGADAPSDDYLSNLLGGNAVPDSNRPRPQQQQQQQSPPQARPRERGGTDAPSDDYLSNLLGGKAVPDSNHQQQQQHSPEIATTQARAADQVPASQFPALPRARDIYSPPEQDVTQPAQVNVEPPSNTAAEPQPTFGNLSHQDLSRYRDVLTTTLPSRPPTGPQQFTGGAKGLRPYTSGDLFDIPDPVDPLMSPTDDTEEGRPVTGGPGTTNVMPKVEEERPVARNMLIGRFFKTNPFSRK
ncbi:hypothetical protein CYMTET_55668 [Cymbomonas tetramitiformis]|uniref:Right handed beta helix domain-containing protein n=1 Tax=Cymbomonas tetramitiformis TaxID=36881 RepID=A0AAE0BDW8_9CHLO|nr:hypothetical protein CYMTET_55668 [Cymbomonas tetramitiformis]